MWFFLSIVTCIKSFVLHCRWITYSSPSFPPLELRPYCVYFASTALTSSPLRLFCFYCIYIDLAHISHFIAPPLRLNASLRPYTSFHLALPLLVALHLALQRSTSYYIAPLRFTSQHIALGHFILGWQSLVFRLSGLVIEALATHLLQ